MLASLVSLAEPGLAHFLRTVGVLVVRDLRQVPPRVVRPDLVQQRYDGRAGRLVHPDMCTPTEQQSPEQNWQSLVQQRHDARRGSLFPARRRVLTHPELESVQPELKATTRPRR